MITRLLDRFALPAGPATTLAGRLNGCCAAACRRCRTSAGFRCANAKRFALATSTGPTGAATDGAGCCCCHRVAVGT
eukprot:SAG22_NODE_17464_length_304_cov_0.873171_1_plen_76_part_10